MPEPSTGLLPASVRPVVKVYLQLVKRIDRQQPDPADIQALRHMLHEHPGLWRLAGDLSHAAALDIIRQLQAGPVVAESLKQARASLMQELGYPAASPLERLVIEQVVLCWLHLNIVQLEYTAVIRQSLVAPAADHWERRLSAAQRRYLRAVDALARIRKLAHKGGVALDQIQFSLAHASIRTAEWHLGLEQDLADPPCDHLGLSLE